MQSQDVKSLVEDCLPWKVHVLGISYNEVFIDLKCERTSL